MAAGEDQPQPVVPKLAVIAPLQTREVLLLELRRRPGEHALLLSEASPAPQPIEPLVTRGAHQPGAGVAGHAGRRPASQSLCEGFLKCVLGEIKVTVEK